MLMKNVNTGEIVKVIGVVEATGITSDGFTRKIYEAVCAVDPRLRGNEFSSYQVRNFSFSSLAPVDLDWDAVRAKYTEDEWEEAKRKVMIDEGYLCPKEKKTMKTGTQGIKGTGMYVFIDEKSGKFLNSHFSGLTEELGEALRLDDSTPMKLIVKGFMENLPKGGVGIVAHEIRFVPVLRF